MTQVHPLTDENGHRRPDEIDLSVVVPLYNEEENVNPLLIELLGVLDGLWLRSEVILVDDGSADRTAVEARAWCGRDPRVRLVELRRNFGQTAAISAGFDLSRGRAIVLMDGDLQNDAHDIPRLLSELEEGHDVVSGWRRRRQDGLLLRRLPSKLANGLISWVTGTRLHDYGCTMKAYRAEVVRHLRLYGEQHRFIPALAQVVGASVVELPVNHRARVRGRSKYGIARTAKVLIDLLTLKFLISYLGRPMRLFGALGFLSMTLGSGALLWLLADKLLLGEGIAARPLLLLGVLLFMAGAQFFSLGILAELGLRIYHEAGGHRPYLVRRVHGADQVPDAGVSGVGSVTE